MTRCSCRHVLQFATILVGVFAVTGGPASAQAPLAADTIRAGRFDGGKMWTFEYAPEAYFSETYDFNADGAWFERARMAAVRIPGCSASFVSPNGLLATNHHCVRSRVSQVSRPGEGLLDNGFYATSRDEERPIPGYYVDQLVAVEDITDEVYASLEGAAAAADRERVRSDVFAQIRERLEERHAADGDNIWVQMIALYNGGRYSAYVFRRFTDIRLVMAVELEMGFFGGDPDNFTYPRYALDFAFLRVYENGEPYETEHYFAWGADGVEAGDVVFVIGNPGPTTRLTTMAQLELLRDVQVPTQRAWLASRHAAFGEFRARYPDVAEALGVRNRMFSLSNSLKAAIGRLDALHTTEIMAKRLDGEHLLRQAIAASPALTAEYGDLFDRMADVQRSKRELGSAYAAFYQLASSTYGSRVLRRMVRAVTFAEARATGAPSETLAMLRDSILSIADRPVDLERRFLAARFADFERYLGPDHPVTRAALVDGTPEASATALLAHSAIASAEKTRAALTAGDPPPDDPALALAGVLGPAYREFQRAFATLQTAERELASRLGRVKFEVYGREVAPDATSSP
ncbi:MAG: S46 family peptidase, partial [Planctomycetota bacterium]